MAERTPGTPVGAFSINIKKEKKDKEKRSNENLVTIHLIDTRPFTVTNSPHSARQGYALAAQRD
jgi:hypothetical protein